MKRKLSLCILLICSGIVLQSGYGDAPGSNPSEPLPIPPANTPLSVKMKELHDKSVALIAAISAKIEALISKAKPSEHNGSCFVKIKCSPDEFKQLVGKNITILSVDEFNQKANQRSSLATPEWWIPTTEMSTNFMTSKNFQMLVDDGYAFALYDEKQKTALFYFDWKQAPEDLK